MMKKNNNNLNARRLKTLNLLKQIIIKNGWNDEIFNLVGKKNKFINEIKILFPDGYKSLMEFYLRHLDNEMIKNTKKIELLRMKTNERIKEILLIRFRIMEKEKKLIKKTFYTLMMPQNIYFAKKKLFETIDNIWFLAGDTSTDFNYYTKRALLTGIYISTINYWVNGNQNLSSISNFLDKKLNQVSKIPKIKKKLNIIYELSPKFFLLFKNLVKSKQ